MRAGRLNQRVTLQALSESRDATGQVVRSYSELGSAWAAVEPLRAREYAAAGRLGNDATHRVILRYRTDLAVTGRIVLGSRTFAITEIRNPAEGRRELQVMVREMVTGAAV